MQNFEQINNDLINLISSGESETVEFKKTFGKEAIETAVAFANTKGGYIFIGLSDDGSIKGVTTSEDQVKDWLNQMKMATLPQLFPQHHICNLNDYRIVILVVSEYPLKPISCKGRYFKRHGASNHLLSSDDIVDLRMQSLNLSFDSFTVDGDIDSLDANALKKFSDNIKESGRYTPSQSVMSDLAKLGFIQNGRLTRAAELLFGNHLTSIHIGRFKSRDTIIDDTVIRAPLILAIDQAMEFIKKSIRLGFEFTGELKRKETWQYPLPVLREFLLNAVIHKDYRDPTDIIIKIFDEHIEFISPGELFGSITLQSLQTDFYKASHRNKLLAEAFYLTGEVEKYGTGFIRVRAQLRNDNPALELTLTNNHGFFTVILGTAPETDYKTDYKTETAHKTAHKAETDYKTDYKTKTDYKAETAPEKEKKTSSREQIIALLKDNPKLTKQDMMKELNKASGTIGEHLLILQRKGRVKRIGSRKTGHWEVIE